MTNVREAAQKNYGEIPSCWACKYEQVFVSKKIWLVQRRARERKRVQIPWVSPRRWPDLHHRHPRHMPVHSICHLCWLPEVHHHVICSVFSNLVRANSQRCQSKKKKHTPSPRIRGEGVPRELLRIALSGHREQSRLLAMYGLVSGVPLWQKKASNTRCMPIVGAGLDVVP